jgi:endonuclease III
MKNATKHAEELRSLFKRLMKEHKPAPMVKQEPLKALVRGAMSYDVSDTKAEEAMKHIDQEFVDLNELRVATDLEIAELLGTRYPDIEKRVELITRSLNAIFEKEHTLNLERLGTISKRDARQFLRDLLPEMPAFVEAYVLLYAFEGHAVPVDDEILGFLREEEIVDEKATPIDAQKFLEHHIKAEECHDFYAVARRAAHSEVGRKKSKGK